MSSDSGPSGWESGKRRWPHPGALPPAADPVTEIDPDSSASGTNPSFPGETQAAPIDPDSLSAPPPPLPATPVAGDTPTMPGRIGKYSIRGVLGKGGMGVVYLGHDPLIDRDVAIKVLSREISQDEGVLRRFLAEAKAAGKLHHPNTVAIYDVGEDNGLYYLVMERIHGGSAEDELSRHGRLPWARATQIIAGACRGLAYAHHEGLVHRDIKPANIMIDQNGTAKIVDFGIAKLADGVQGYTATGANFFIGTPQFMSPEQCQALSTDGRSDVYSLGATYYTLLTGQPPYASIVSVVQVLYAHVNTPVPDVRSQEPNIPAPCWDIIKRSMAKKPEKRYQSADEMLDDLENLLREAGESPRPAIGLQTSVGGRDQTIRMIRRQSRRAMIAAGVGGVASIAGAGGLFAAWKYWSGAAPAVAANSATVKVGVILPTTGSLGVSGQSVLEAAMLAFDEINAKGGLLGKTLQPLVGDVKSDPLLAQDEAERLLGEEKVVALFGPWTSASRKQILPTLEKYDALLVYPLQYEGLESSPYVLYTGATPNQQIVPAIQSVYAFRNRRKFFIIGSDYVFPRAASVIIFDTVKQVGGQVVGEEYIPIGGYDLGPIVDKIKASGADIVINMINGDSNIPYFQTMRSKGLTPEKLPTLSFSFAEQELLALDIRKMVGDFASWNYFQSIDSPENADFVARFRRRFGPTRVIGDPMESMYVGVKLWAQAVAQAKTFDPPAVRMALRGQEYTSPGGPVKVDPSNNHLWKIARLGQIRADGQFEIVISSPRPIEPIPFPPTRTREEWETFLSSLREKWKGAWANPDG